MRTNEADAEVAAADIAHVSGRVPTFGEVRAVWVLWAAVLLAVFITYTRNDPDDLYNVSRGGVAGGLSRVLVESNFPVALVAIATVLLVFDVLSHRARIVGAIAVALCAVTVWPGVVDQGDLDARWVNVVPAMGVVCAAALSATALRHAGTALQPRQPFDLGRVVLIVAIVLVALPWIAATAGFYLPDVVYLTGRVVADGDHRSAAVHHGLHHGFDGAAMAVCAIALSRLPRSPGRLGAATRAYIALMFGYGVVNAVQDAWGEQIVKRGWSSHHIPSAAEPQLHPVWLVVLTIGAVAWFVQRAEDRRRAAV